MERSRAGEASLQLVDEGLVGRLHALIEGTVVTLPSGLVAASEIERERFRGHLSAGVLEAFERAAPRVRPADDGTPGQALPFRDLHAHGDGVRKDLGLAIKLYRRACKGGNARGCVNLGQAYELGDRVPVDPAAAAELYERVCLAEHPAGCSGLARLYDLGSGVPKDPRFAVDLLEKACGFSGMDACVELGIRHDNGHGTPIDVQPRADAFTAQR